MKNISVTNNKLNKYIIEGLLSDNKELFVQRLAMIVDIDLLDKLATPKVTDFVLDNDAFINHVINSARYNNIVEVSIKDYSVVNGEVIIKYNYAEKVYYASQEDKVKGERGDYVCYNREINDNYHIEGLYIRTNQTINPSIEVLQNICKRLTLDTGEAWDSGEDLFD